MPLEPICSRTLSVYIVKYLIFCCASMVIHSSYDPYGRATSHQIETMQCITCVSHIHHLSTIDIFAGWEGRRHYCRYRICCGGDLHTGSSSGSCKRHCFFLECFLECISPSSRHRITLPHRQVHLWGFKSDFEDGIWQTNKKEGGSKIS